jgi:eukaryotic-like serine/threonine-protein kinase
MRRYVASFAVICGVGAMALAPAANSYTVPKVCKVPSVVGKTLSSAQRAITKANCEVGSITTKTSSKPKDQVISQSPAAGSSGPTVKLTVSLGTPKPGAKCVVPDVVGKSLSAADAALVKADCGVGSVTQKTSKKPKGQVLTQSIAGGKREALGTKVSLTVSKGKAKKGKK